MTKRLTEGEAMPPLNAVQEIGCRKGRISTPVQAIKSRGAVQRILFAIATVLGKPLASDSKYIPAVCLTVCALFVGQGFAQDSHPYRSISAPALRSDALIGSATTTFDRGSIAVEQALSEVSRPMSAAPAPNPNLASLILSNPSFAKLQALLADSQMARIDVTLRQSLVADGQRLATERGSLLPQARELDSRNEAIQQEAERLNADHRQNEVEKAELQKLLNEHNSRCNPAPNDGVYQWCLRNADQLNPRINSYNRLVAEHNGKVEEWKRKSADLGTAWSAFWKILSAWEQAVIRLGEKIQQLIDTPKTEKCQYLARSTGNLCIYSCPSGIRYWPPDADGECKKPDAELPVEGGGVGTPSIFVR